MNANTQDALAAIALLLMGLLAALLIFFKVPDTNQQLVTFALGAISGAMTVGGVSKLGGALKPPPDQSPNP